MYAIYFDENKFCKESPFFWIGGILLKDDKLSQIESNIMQIQYNFFGTNILTKDTELHGIAIYQGKENFKKRKLEERIKLLSDMTKLITSHSIPVRLVCINVNAHKEKYVYPQPEYNLGLMLALERFCDYLSTVDDIGMVFGDFEKDEVTKSILDFSQFKHSGKTPMYFGRPLGRLIDTLYFSQSHHSRFLQLTDIVIYLANRFENNSNIPTKWHEIEAKKLWEDMKRGTDFLIQRWP